MPFQPGNQFGNRKGRPKLGLALAEKVRELAGQDGAAYLDQLHLIATGQHKDVKSRLTAIGMLLDRGWGKPLQEIDLTHRDEADDPSTLNDTELKARALALIRQLTDQTDPPLDGSSIAH